MLLGSLVGVLLGALLVSLIFLAGRFGEVLGYAITGAAGVGSGHLVGLVAGRREVIVASLSIVAGVLLVALVFFQQTLSMQAGLDMSDPLTLVFLGIPLTVLTALGGWLAELARGSGFYSGGERASSPLELPTGVLVGAAVAILVIVGLLLLSSGAFEESPA